MGDNPILNLCMADRGPNKKKVMQKFRLLSFRQWGFNGAIHREIKLWFVLQNYLPGCSVKMEHSDKRLTEREKMGKFCQGRDDEGNKYRTAKAEIQGI